MMATVGWRPTSVITCTILTVGLLATPGAVVAQDDGHDRDHGAAAGLIAGGSIVG
jgi:hypothetical protein